jgi:hydroxymethylpyrimidine pyrophosphatase-like HAD family hydrolase
MRYLALATDYDGTLAHHGTVSDDTWAAVQRLRDSGRKALLVTGRELEDLQRVCPRLDLFDLVVAENGALLYRPTTRELRPLAEPPPEELLQELRRRGVAPVSVGHAIVATWEPHQSAVLGAIHDLGLELHVIFNKGAVMVLPTGVNKASGLGAALAELCLSPHNVVGVGDAENDHAFLALCECAAAVANALPTLRAHADLVTRGPHGEGVVELIDALLADDLRSLEGKLLRHHVLLGRREDGAAVRVPPYGATLLVAGPSGSGKSSVTTGLLERLAKAGYQFCVIDPEGDYDNLEGAAVLGTPRRAPESGEVLRLLGTGGQNVVVNLLGVPLADRPPYFAGLLPRLQELRAAAGRPHWLVLDEAHHLLPAEWAPALAALPQRLEGALLITVHPDAVAPAVLACVTTVVAVGDEPARTLGRVAAALKEPPPGGASGPQGPGEVVAWVRAPRPEPPFRLQAEPPHAERLRHSRKYAEGELPPERSFYFRGPEGKLNLRCRNLVFFLEMAAGVDDDTWLHHLRQGDYSRWFREAIKDRDLAAEAEAVERREGLSAAASREQIRQAVERRYTLPADAAAAAAEREARAGRGDRPS